MICIGYIGVEAFDIILYIGKTLTILNYPVLIIDLSDTGTLTHTLYHGMGLDSKSNIIDYRDINYTRKLPEDKELADYKDGVIFIVYGLNNNWSTSLSPDYLNIVLDAFPSSGKKVNEYLSNIKIDNIKVRLLVRNIITRDDYDRVKNSILSEIRPISSRYIYYDMNDYENAIKCQVSQAISFRKVSASMRKYIRSEIADLLPSIKPFIIRRAINRAMKGEYYR